MKYLHETNTDTIKYLQNGEELVYLAILSIIRLDIRGETCILLSHDYLFQQIGEPWVLLKFSS